MKAYNLGTIKKTFSWGELTAISLGEDGRGRKLTLVPCPEGLANGDEVALGATKSGGIKVVKTTTVVNDDLLWVAKLSGDGCYTRGTYGSVYVYIEELSAAKAFKVLASGYGAFGTAGRIGDYNEFLVQCQAGTWFKVRPAGGAHKRARYWLYFGAETVTVLDSADEVEAFCEAADLNLPPLGDGFEGYKDLAL